MQHNLRVFEPSGELVANLGREGAGPGEFQFVVGMWVVPPDTIRVLDAATRRITTYLETGSLVESHRVTLGSGPEASRGSPDLVVDGLPRGEVVLGWTIATLAGGPSSQDSMVFGRFGSTGELRQVIGEEPGMRRSAGSPIVFTPFPFAVVLGDSLYFTNGQDARISVRGVSGGDTRSLELPIEMVSVGDAWRLMADALRRKNKGVVPQRIAELPKAGSVPRIGGLLVGGHDEIWAKVFDPGADPVYVKSGSWGAGGEWLVVSRDGTLEAKISMPRDFMPTDVRGGEVLGIQTDSLGVQTLAVYRISR
jgi:hypothetical protein